MRLAAGAIPLASRIALLAQVADVFQFSHGPSAAAAEIRRRSGRWFDPKVVDAFMQVARSERFWTVLAQPDLATHVLALEPGDDAVPVDEDYLDAIAEAFGVVIDAKSPFTSGHSERVGYYTDGLALRLGIAPARRRWLRRAALLHDVGKLGVSNTILDKRGPLDEAEWAQVRMHAVHSEQILSRITPFAELARIAAAHHERLDGTGYPRGLHAEEIAMETRIITTADVFDAITAERPYHPPCSAERALDTMRAHVGTALDADCFAALESMTGVAVAA
jgi:HD-GYP domain-containing protein (c-di-GMP phosphodiesterase class II)